MKFDFNSYIIPVLCVFCLFLYVVGMTGISLTDPDEVFYAGTAKEMLSHQDMMTPYIFGEPQFEKPPLFYWLIILSYKIFGIGTFAARIIPAIFGVIGVLATYRFVLSFAGRSAALYSSLISATSIAYFVMSKGVLTDIAFSVFLVISLYNFYRWHSLGKEKHIILFAVFSALSVLTKGPVGIIIPLIAIFLFLLLRGEWKRFGSFAFHRWWIVFLAISLPWYIYIYAKYNSMFWNEFIVHDNWHRILYAEHKHLDRWYYYPVVIIAGMFPWISHIFFLKKWDKASAGFFTFLIASIVSVIAVFAGAHSKLPSYILPLFPLIAIIFGTMFSYMEFMPYQRITAGVINIIIGLALLFVPLFVKKAYTDFFPVSLWSFTILSAGMMSSGLLFITAKYRWAFYSAITSFSIFVVIIALSVPPRLEGAFTNSDMSELVTHYSYSGKEIVCSKIFVRGVSFYSDNPVVVTDGSANPFWSRHPVKILWRKRDILKFFRHKDRVLCVVDEDDLERLNKILSKRRANRVVKDSLYRFVLLSEKKKPDSKEIKKDAGESADTAI